MRVVSLTCSNTEIVCALGCAEMLVGVDDHSDSPPEVVRSLPRVGPDLGIDVERVAALEPDLVLASLTVPGHERVVESLERAGLSHIAPEPVSISDIYDDIRTLASALGVPERAGPVIEQMRSELVPSPPPSEGRPAILVEWWPKPVIVPGRDSWVNQLLHAAGATNPMGDRAVKSAPVSDDEVVQMAPDAVVISWCGVRPEKYRPDVVRRRTAWHELPALRNGRVYCVPEAHLGRPAPALALGCRAFRRIVSEVASDPGRRSR